LVPLYEARKDLLRGIVAVDYVLVRGLEFEITGTSLLRRNMRLVIRALLAAVLMAVSCASPVEAAEPVSVPQWRLTGERVNGTARNAEDRYGNVPWRFLRTTSSEGPVTSRRWLRDGKYVPLDHRGENFFDQPISGAIYQVEPTWKAPFVGGITATHAADVTWKKGEVLVSPGPEHAAILAWQSPVSGTLAISGTVDNRQTCCGVNSQVNWYVEHGSGPDVINGFKPVTLAQGISDDKVEGGVARFEVVDLEISVGDYIYIVVDARADGTATPHHGDATAVDARITVAGATLPPPPTFKQDVLPVLARNCFECHGEDLREADLDLRTVSTMIFGGESGSVLTPGKLETSYLWTMIQSGQMPPQGAGTLSSAEKAVIRRWISGGAATDEDLTNARVREFVSAEDREHWAFQPPVRPPLPAIRNPGLASSPIDYFLLKRLEGKGLTYSAAASKETLVRRLTFDLTGLPPTPQQVDAFLGDVSPDAYDKLVDGLLASPRYGERWGRHWMDTVGYVDVRLYDGDATTLYPNEGIWRYRDYIIRSFNADKPYDQFLQEQLAGDEMVDWRNASEWTPEIMEKLVATGYLRSVEDHTSEPQYGIDRRYEVLFDMMTMVSTSMLGLTFECTRCHNHKYDPITQRDYYRLMSFFESSYNAHQWLKPQDRWIPDVGPVARVEIDRHNAEVDGKVNTLQSRIKELEKAGDGGADQTSTLKKMVADLNGSKRSYGKIQALFDVPNPPVTHVFRRGDCFKRGIPVTPGFPEVLAPATSPGQQLARVELPLPPGTSGRRLELADWITSRKNPTTARVIMNRLWLHHFGEGIVATPGNIGRNGAPPSHPEILDWMAVEFQESGWSLKKMHQFVLTSQAYRQASRRSVELTRAEKLDPDNRLLWRQNLKRLESELIRDSLLAASGRLDFHSFGPPVPVTMPVSGLSMVDPGGGNGQNRRSVYIFARRVYPLKFMEIFDSPIMAINCARRLNSTTVLQSFAQLNSDFVIGVAGDAARRIEQAVGNEPGKLVRSSYRTILGRLPSGDEQQACLEFLSVQVAGYRAENQDEKADMLAFADLCHMLLCMNEFLYVE